MRARPGVQGTSSVGAAMTATATGNCSPSKCLVRPRRSLDPRVYAFGRRRRRDEKVCPYGTKNGRVRLHIFTAANIIAPGPGEQLRTEYKTDTPATVVVTQKFTLSNV